VARAAGVPVLLDACQSVGQRVLDVDALGCDMLTATGRKFLRGPRGSGFLYVRRGYQASFEPPMLDNISARWVADDRYEVVAGARRYEQFEGAIAARVGLGVAIRALLDLGPAAVERRITQLASQLREQLSATPGVTVHDRGRAQCGIVTFSVADRPAAQVKAALRERGVELSVTEVASYRMGMAHRGLDAVVRASPHVFNNTADLRRCVEGVAAVGR
jgi:selenocysteine lyase/cysteine desulfurase